MTYVGRNLGKYRVLEQLGSGGMSVVYKGLDTVLDREVAIKILHPHLASKAESRQRLAREAKAVAKLHHPNILEVFDFSGASSDDAYIVTEYIRGQTLRQFADGRRLEPAEVAAMVVHQVAGALAHAHEEGIIHRDLKPENVMVRSDGVVKLMDFGIAKIVDRDDKMTMTGALVGSPAHMAPEVIEGQEAGATADVFSLGTLLYFLTTGTLPFNAANTTATLKRILDGTYDDPRKWTPALADDLAQVLSRCLARDPPARYPHAGALRDALGAYLGSMGVESVAEELSTYFADPASYQADLGRRLTGRLLVQARERLAEGRPAAALSALDHLLALAPDHEAANALLRAMSTAERGRRFRRKAGWAVALLVGVGGAAGAWTVRRPSEPASALSVRGLHPVPPAPAPTPPAPVSAPRPSGPRAGGRARAVRPEPSPPGVAPVAVTLNVFPFGYVRVDDGARSPEASAVHPLALTPGPHRVSVSCDGLCEEAVASVDVDEGGPNQFYLTPTLKASKVMFDFQPPQAVVTVRGVSKTALESQRNPFEIRSNKPKELRHEIEYEVRYPGFETVRKAIKVTPGESLRVEGSLERAMNTAVLLLGLAVVSQARGAGDADVADVRTQVEHGQYREALRRAKARLERGELSEEDRLELLKQAGVSAFNLKDREEAERQFSALLRVDPDYTLDPFVVPPPTVAFFDALRRKLDPSLQEIRAERRERLRAEAEERARTQAAEAQLDAQRRRIEELTRQVALRAVERRPFWINFLPFGAGQFQQRRTGLGTALAVSQATLAVTSIASFAAVAGLVDEQEIPVETEPGRTVNVPVRFVAEGNRGRLNTLKTLRIASGVGFYALYVFGVVDAIGRHRTPAPLPAAGDESTTGVAPGRLVPYGFGLAGGGGAGVRTVF